MLQGRTIVVVSGIAKRAPQYRQIVESLGGRAVLLQPEDLRKMPAVAGAFRVVLITKSLSHKATSKILSYLHGDRSSIIYVNGTGITLFQQVLTDALKGVPDTG